MEIQKVSLNLIPSGQRVVQRSSLVTNDGTLGFGPEADGNQERQAVVGHTPPTIRNFLEEFWELFGPPHPAFREKITSRI